MIEDSCSLNLEHVQTDFVLTTCILYSDQEYVVSVECSWLKRYVYKKFQIKNQKMVIACI